MAYSPDGKRIVCASQDMTLKVWDASTGAVLLSLKGQGAPVTSVAYSPDGIRIVSGPSTPGRLRCGTRARVPWSEP